MKYLFLIIIESHCLPKSNDFQGNNKFKFSDTNNLINADDNNKRVDFFEISTALILHLKSKISTLSYASIKEIMEYL